MKLHLVKFEDGTYGVLEVSDGGEPQIYNADLELIDDVEPEHMIGQVVREIPFSWIEPPTEGHPGLWDIDTEVPELDIFDQSIRDSRYGLRKAIEHVLTAHDYDKEFGTNAETLALYVIGQLETLRKTLAVVRVKEMK
jgi:hypothetical protein